MKIEIEIAPWMRSIYDRERIGPLLRTGTQWTVEQWAAKILQAHCAQVRDRKGQDRLLWQTREDEE
jgi:hypothetical protein